MLPITHKIISLMIAVYPHLPEEKRRKIYAPIFKTLWLLLGNRTSFPVHVIKCQHQLTQFWRYQGKIKIWNNAVLYLDDPKKWGPLYWQFFHQQLPLFIYSRTLSPVSSLLYYISFVFPCDKCAKSFRKLLQTWAPEIHQIKSRKQFRQFINFIHIKVTEKIVNEKNIN